MGENEKRAFIFKMYFLKNTTFFCVKFGYVFQDQISYLSTKRQRAIFVREIHPRKDNCDFYTFKTHMRYV